MKKKFKQNNKRLKHYHNRCWYNFSFSWFSLCLAELIQLIHTQAQNQQQQKRDRRICYNFNNFFFVSFHSLFFIYWFPCFDVKLTFLIHEKLFFWGFFFCFLSFCALVKNTLKNEKNRKFWRQNKHFCAICQYVENWSLKMWKLHKS